MLNGALSRRSRHIGELLARIGNDAIDGARDIAHAVRGGRIPAWAEPVVRWTGLTPVAKVNADGKLGIAGGLFAQRRACRTRRAGGRVAVGAVGKNRGNRRHCRASGNPLP